MATSKLFELNEDTLELVVRSLNYTSLKSFEEDVKTISKWTKEQQHFPETMDDNKIRNFLILNRGSIENTKEKIDNYYTARSILPEIYNEINPKLSHMQQLLDAFYFVPLPKMTKEMYRVALYKTREKSLLESFDPILGIRHLLNLQELRLSSDVMGGEIFVIDGSDVPLSSILNITPTVLHKAIVIIYKRIFANRIKAIYIVNAPSFIDKFLFILKAVLTPKIFSRIHFCESTDVLLEKVGKEVLPKDYGGDEKSLEEIQQTLRKEFEEHKSYFDKLDTLRVEEKLRPEKLQNDDLLGFHGNFKKLDLD